MESVRGSVFGFFFSQSTSGPCKAVSHYPPPPPHTPPAPTTCPFYVHFSPFPFLLLFSLVLRHESPVFCLPIDFHFPPSAFHSPFLCWAGNPGGKKLVRNRTTGLGIQPLAMDTESMDTKENRSFLKSGNDGILIPARTRADGVPHTLKTRNQRIPSTRGG